ncbi:hypothetical protein SAMCCGM7_Ch2678 [Sinorhizobium americanum CCGM7]|uniref:hypothetical protein n=1 Tax=Sinorhizobium americanum TaxID=194963 RepID=UPI0004D889A9|nr:hypothetical protein [Sinorhizobium americanum]APG85415.1 hypothetical protein SAMCCGM7_Ch2678 [Sinorhizobium americanum CCGM7]
MQSLGAVLTALLAVDFGAAASRFKRNAALWGIVAVLLITAYVFALVAIALVLAEYYSPIIASVAIAVALLAVALMIVALMAVRNARDRRLVDERRRRSLLQTNLALAAATSILRKQPLIGVGTAIAVGLLLGLGKRRCRSDRR